MFFFEHHGLKDKDTFRFIKMRNQSFPAHLHRAYELIFVNGGTLSVQVEQKHYLLRENDLVFIFCNQIHSFSASEQAEVSVVLFSPEIIGDFYLRYKGHVPEDNVIRLKNQLDFSDLNSIYAQKSMLYHICDELLGNTKMETVDSKSQVVVVQQIFAYVDKHFKEDCSLKNVSRALKYDYAYLSKVFTRLIGMHFTEYLNNYRIAQACYMLKAGKYTVSEIAALCGYSTLRTFHRNFRTTMHCSPSEYLIENVEQGI